MAAVTICNDFGAQENKVCHYFHPALPCHLFAMKWWDWWKWEESEKVGLKLNIQKTKIMASGPINSQQTDGKTVETVADFNFWAPKSLQMVTAVMKLKDICSLEEKLHKPRQCIKK